MTKENINQELNEKKPTQERELAKRIEEEVKKERVIEGVEKRLTPEEEMIKEKIKKELTELKFTSAEEKEIKEKARKIERLGQEEKLKKLFQLANKEGLFFAIKVAKEMKDEYLLDLFHDLLARDHYYKKFIK
ncbi:MAG: hypothetical protein ACPLW9_01465 [Minisyncoccales bacterium]